MKKRTKLLSLLLTMILTFSVGITACAAEGDAGFSDVSESAWYAEAVTYCRDNNIMGNTAGPNFEPQTPMDRAMLAAVLWRMDGSPVPSAGSLFSDAPAGRWYSNAVAWAAEKGIVSGYSAQTFGTNDTVTREQIAAILYRYAAYKGLAGEIPAQLNFTDAADIAVWASDAVKWSQSKGIISGKTGNRFDPKGKTSRAEAAAILYRYLSPAAVKPDNSAGEEKILIAYFSRTGSTKTLAEHIRKMTGGDLFEIVTAQPYPADYDECTAQAKEELAADFRPQLSSHVRSIDDYDVVFVGYPIWYSNTPMAIRSFLEEYDLSGKTIVPFCTHGGSGLAQSAAAITSLCPKSTISKGLAVTGTDAENVQNTVSAWIKELGIDTDI